MDEQAFDALYTASYRRLVVQVHALCGSRAEAEDCVQEAFARAWSHRRRLDSEAHPEAWVRTAAFRLAVSRWRRIRRETRADEALERDGSGRGPDESRTALVAALRRLPEPQRRAIVLHHIADLSVAEVARETGVAVGTVKARLSRGRAALAALLAEPLDPTSEGARRA